jgi:hypothetical protein
LGSFCSSIGVYGSTIGRKFVAAVIRGLEVVYVKCDKVRVNRDVEECRPVLPTASTSIAEKNPAS